MDKIMSNRMDEAVIRHIDMLAKRLGTSQKAILENAVRYYAEKVEAEQGFDVLTDTFGSWQRDNSAAKTVQTIKDTMRKSHERYKRRRPILIQMCSFGICAVNARRSICSKCFGIKSSTSCGSVP